MKALSLDQPYATLAAIGAKKWETRGWRPSVKKGELFAIAATARYSELSQTMEDFPEFRFALRRIERPLPTGKIIAVARIGEVISTMEWVRRFCRRGMLEKHESEYCFGDYSPNRFAWELIDVTPLATPLACSGMQRFWSVPDDLHRRIVEQLAVPA